MTLLETFICTLCGVTFLLTFVNGVDRDQFSASTGATISIFHLLFAIAVFIILATHTDENNRECQSHTGYIISLPEEYPEITNQVDKPDTLIATIHRDTIKFEFLVARRNKHLFK